MKVAIVASHPIQYQAPVFRRLAREPGLDVKVYFGWDFGVRDTQDATFGVAFKWDVPLLEGYEHEFLPNLARHPGTHRFLGVNNPALANRLRRDKPDVVVLHGYALATSWIGWAAARAARIPIVFRGETLLREPSARGARRRAKDAATRAFLRGVDACLPIGSRSQAFYDHHGVPRERQVLAPYCVDNDRFFAAAKEWAPRRDETLRAAGLDPGLPVALFAGKLYDHKRPADFVRALAKLRGDVQGIVVGEGPLRPALEELARREGADHVRFVGFQNQSQMPRWYAAVDVLALPSQSETWGLVVNEAMCFGVPVVASAGVAAGDDLILPMGAGSVHAVGDVEAMRAQLAAVLLDPPARAVQGRAALDAVRRWNVDACAEGFMRALRLVVARRG